MYLQNSSAKPSLAVTGSRTSFWSLKQMVSWTLLRNPRTLNEALWLLTNSYLFTCKSSFQWLKPAVFYLQENTGESTNNKLFLFQLNIKTLLLDFWWPSCFSWWDRQLCPISSTDHAEFVFVTFLSSSFWVLFSPSISEIYLFHSLFILILQVEHFSIKDLPNRALNGCHSSVTHLSSVTLHPFHIDKTLQGKSRMATVMPAVVLFALDGIN